MNVLGAAAVDSALVCAGALLLCRLLARRAAALRHVILAASLAAAAAAPLLETTLPRWELPIMSSSSQVTSSGLTLSSESPAAAVPAVDETAATPRISWAAALAAVWSIGFIAVMSGLLLGIARLVWATRRCQPIASSTWREQTEALSSQYAMTRPVVVLQSPNRALLLTWGLFRPRIIVPAVAASWTVERIQVVLAHELAHIRRGDWAVQLAAEALRAVYWFNPLVWIACSRLRHESEYACDDAVLESGIEATDYAAHLLDVARQAIGYRDMWASAPAVANPSTLERRISAMLSDTRNRQPLTRRARVCAVVAAIVVAAPIAAIAITEPAAEPVTTVAGVDVALVASTPVETIAPVAPPPARPASQPARVVAPAPPALQATGSLSGVMSDASGGVLPGVEVTLTDANGIRYSRVSDGTGSFTFPDLPPGRYALVAQLPGFTSVRADLALEAGQNLQRRLSLRVGSLQETLTVTCPAGGAALPALGRGVMALERRAVTTRLFTLPQDAPRAQDQPASKPVRVGGQIRAPRQVKKVNPICPQLLLPPPEGTVVILEARIGTDGYTHDIRPLRPGSSTEFTESAIESVRQWQYTPTLLNNVAVPVIMTVTVSYQRS